MNNNNITHNIFLTEIIELIFGRFYLTFVHFRYRRYLDSYGINEKN